MNTSIKLKAKEIAFKFNKHQMQRIISKEVLFDTIMNLSIIILFFIAIIAFITSNHPLFKLMIILWIIGSIPFFIYHIFIIMHLIKNEEVQLSQNNIKITNENNVYLNSKWKDIDNIKMTFRLFLPYSTIKIVLMKGGKKYTIERIKYDELDFWIIVWFIKRMSDKFNIPMKLHRFVRLE